jgi:hypothetical protein
VLDEFAIGDPPVSILRRELDIRRVPAQTVGTECTVPGVLS